MQQNEPLEILSPNFTEEDLKDWRSTTMLVTHEPIRSGMNTLMEITNKKYYTTTDCKVLEKKMKLLFKWYNDIFYKFVIHHHNVEEKIYYPWILSKTEALPEKLSKDLATLNKMLDEIKNSRSSFYATGDDKNKLDADNFKKNLQELHVLSEKLYKNMSQHLDEEERIVPVLLIQYDIKQAEESAVVDEIIEGLGLSANKVMLPWITDCMLRWGGAQRVKEFMSHVPLRMRCRKWLSWDWHYVKDNKNIIDSIANL